MNKTYSDWEMFGLYYVAQTFTAQLVACYLANGIRIASYPAMQQNRRHGTKITRAAWSAQPNQPAVHEPALTDHRGCANGRFSAAFPRRPGPH
jgi:hypothetical protein